MSNRLLVWILQTGEPLHCDEGNPRPMRAMNLANSLAEYGHSVILWSSSFYHQEKTHRCNKYKSIKISDSIEIRLIPSPGYQKNISFARLWDHAILAKNLKKILKQEIRMPDVAFVGYPPIESAAVMTRWLSGHKVPCVLDVKDQWPSFMVDALPRLARPFGYIAFSPYFYFADRAMKESTGLSAMAEDFLQWALNFSKRSKTVNDIVVPLTTASGAVSENDMLDAFNWWTQFDVYKDEKMRVMFVGSHYPSLDFSPIFDASAKLSKNGIECDFIICGQGELTESLLKEAESHPNVIFPGWVDRPKIEALAQMSMASLAPFRNIDCYIKSLPNKVIDALSLGLPILSPLSGEVRKLIEENEVGLFYEQSSGDSLFQNVNNLWEDKELREKLSSNAKELFANRFSYEKVYGGLVKHLEKLSGS